MPSSSAANATPPTLALPQCEAWIMPGDCLDVLADSVDLIVAGGRWHGSQHTTLRTVGRTELPTFVPLG